MSQKKFITIRTQKLLNLREYETVSDTILVKTGLYWSVGPGNRDEWTCAYCG